MKTAIMGVGSLGTITGALLSKNGIDVTLIDANRAHVEALNERGATVIGKMQLQNIPVKAILPSQMEGIYDVVILMAKQTYNDVALAQVLPHLGDESVVCTLQNGVPEEFVSTIVGKERTVGGAVGWGASFIGPGTSELTSDISAMRYEIGEMDGSVTERIQKIADILNQAGECTITENLMGIRWAKVLQNASMSGMSAALGAVWYQILDDDKALACAAHVTNEVIKVTRAHGVQLEELVPGWSFYDAAFATEEELEKSKRWHRAYYEPHRSLKASMLQDMEKHIPCEIDYIVGICSDLGKKYAIATPVCDTIIRIVKEYEKGEIAMPTMDCLSRFSLPQL